MLQHLALLPFLSLHPVQRPELPSQEPDLPRQDEVEEVAVETLSLMQFGDELRLHGPEGQLLRVTTEPITGARMVRVAGTRVVLWYEGSVPFAAVQVPGQEFRAGRELDPLLHLRGGAFDPLSGLPEIDAGLEAQAGSHSYIVQLATPSLGDLRAALREQGAELLRYLPANAHIVSMDSAAAASIAELDFVRWVGLYQPQHRLEEALLAGLEEGSLAGQQHYLIQVMRSGLEDKQSVAQRVQEVGGTAGAPVAEGLFLDAHLSAEQLVQIARMDEVLFIDRHGEARTYMDKVRVDGGANFLESMTGFTGQGVAGEVLDSGVQLGHPEFQVNPPIVHHHNSTNTSHGTAVAGIVFSSGANNSASRGLLPDGQMIASSFIGGVGNGNRYVHTAELLQPPYEAVFQTNSWGYGTTTSYNNWSTQIDDILFQYDIVILQAQANNGNTNSDGFAWGKNVVSVGGIRHYNTQSLSDDAWNNAGSRGPAEDGRIKPDLSYWYDSIFTTATGSTYTSNFGGTSAATPESAGHFGLFFQMWHENAFGTNPGGATVFESRPRSSLARAVVINTADQYPFQGGQADLKRVTQGWGRPDVQRMYELRDRMFFVNETEVLTELESRSWQLEVPAGEPELRATMVYTDLPGTTSSSQHRINDVTLKVTSPGGDVYWGNYLMKTNMFTQLGGAPNNKDTVENVWVENPEPGLWTVEVSADEINADARPETPGVDDVDFSLVVSGVLTGDCVAPAVACSSSANSSGQVATLATTGSVSVAANDLVFQASQLPATQNAVLFYGASQSSVPFGNGTLCVGSPFGRLDIVQASAIGEASWALDVNDPPNTATQITAGTTWYFQAWYRDPAAGGAAFNLSESLEVVFCD